MEARNSFERILAVLELFTEGRPEWTPDAMMAELGYSRPTLYRYLKALRGAGLLTSLPGAGFTLGPKVVEMDYLIRQSDGLVQLGQPHLERLAALWPCTTLLVRWYGSRILCVASEGSAAAPISSFPRGRPMPLVRGAIARSIMAFLPRRQLVPMIEGNLEEFRAVRLGDSPDAVIESLRRVRRMGYAIARGEVTPGVVGVAAPIFDAARTPFASLAATLAAGSTSEADVERVAQEVRAAATDISVRLNLRRSAGPAPVFENERDST